MPAKMKRRDFLKTPGLGLLVPGTITLERYLTSRELLDQDKTPVVEVRQIEQRMHPDFITYLDGIEYFYLGNGDIMGAIQYSPQEARATFAGMTLMHPEHFCRKWSTFLYHPEKGFGSTKLGVTVDEKTPAADSKSGMYTGVKGFSVAPDNFRSVSWKYPDRVPTVSLIWNAGGCDVEEEYFVPGEGAVLFRRIIVRNLTGKELDIKLSVSLYPNFGLFDEIYTDEKEKVAHASGLARMKLFSLDKSSSVAGRYDVRIDLGRLKSQESRKATYVYAIDDGDKTITKKGFEKVWSETKHYWNEKNRLETGNDIVDNLFRVSMTGLRAVIARSSKMDAGVWMYNMEWLGDQALAVEALLRAGFAEEARVMLERNLKSSIGKDGRTIESSRWFGYEYTEINQNGILLYSLWAYLSWTGDYALIRKNWEKIKLCAEFPLQDVFLDKGTKMVRNKREFWERSDSHGFEDGYELAYQFWVAFGLEKAAFIARAIGDTTLAQKWQKVVDVMKHTMLNHPIYKLIEDGHFIKRRTVDGRWQRYVTPPDRKKMPPGSPLATEEKPSPEPDTIEVLPIIYEMIDPGSDLSSKTLQWVETLWNQRWKTGGYPRYNVTSEDNPPAPWPIPSVLVARAYAAAGNDEKVWRILEWLHGINGGKSGSWFERYGQSITPPMPPVGVVGWVWYELIALFVHHVVGFRPELNRLLISPHLLQGINETKSTHTVRDTKVDLTIRRSKGKSRAIVSGKEMPMPGGSLSLPYPKTRSLGIEIDIAG
jgi:hypothetical protein